MNKNNLFKIFNNCAINKDQANKKILKNSSFESSFNSVPSPCFADKGLQPLSLPLVATLKGGLLCKGEDNKNINNPKFSSILRAIRTICLSRDELKIFRLINIMERKKINNNKFISTAAWAEGKADIGVNNINKVNNIKSVNGVNSVNGITGVNGVDKDIISTSIGSIITELKETYLNANNTQIPNMPEAEAPTLLSQGEASLYNLERQGGKTINLFRTKKKLAKKLKLEQIKKQEAELQTKFFSLKQNIKIITYNNIINNNILLRNRNYNFLKSTLTNLLKKRIRTISEVLEDKPIKNYILFQYLKNFIFAKTKLNLNKYCRKFGTFIHYNKIIGYKFNSTFYSSNISEKEKEIISISRTTNYNSETERITDIYKLLFYFFKSMYCLISKPVLKYTNDKITIQLFYYLNIPKKKIFRFFSILYINSIKKKWLLRKQAEANAKKRTKLLNRFGSQANLVSRLPKLYIRWKLRKAISRFKNKNLLFPSLRPGLLKLNPPLHRQGVPLSAKQGGGAIQILLFKLRKFNLTKVYQSKFKLICNILSKKFNKPVELQLIRLHHPYHDSNILVNLLSLNFKNKRKKARVAVQKIYNKKPVKNLNDPNLNSVKFIPAFLSGLNIKIAGRLMGEPIIPRITTKVFGKGASATGKVNYLDIARITKKNRKGAYTIKITSGQNFF